MKRFKQSFVDDILRDYDVLKLAQDQGWQLPTSAGKKTECPFPDDHKNGHDRTKSFQINEKHNTVRCFGCQFGGNGIGPLKYYMQEENLKFPEAIAVMAKSLHRELEYEVGPSDPRADARRAEYKQAFDVVQVAKRYFIDCLNTNPDVMRYLTEDRGMPVEQVRKIGMGFAPNDRGQGLANAITSAGFSMDDAIRAGLFSQKDGRPPWPTFYNRVMFPINDTRENTISFGGRVLKGAEDDKYNSGKYRNGPETILFKKHRNLYNFLPAIKASKDDGMVIFVEGYMDVEGLRSAGVENSVAGLGTAITEDQLRLLMGRVGEVCFCLDGDAAGQRAAEEGMKRCLPLLDGTTAVSFAFMPDGYDPDDYAKEFGGDKFLDITYNATPLSEMFIAVCSKGLRDRLEDRAKMEKNASKLLAQMPSSPFREMLVEALCDRLSLSKSTLLNYLPKPASAPAQAPAHTEFATADVDDEKRREVIQASKTQLERSEDRAPMVVPERRGDKLKKHSITPYQLFASRQRQNIVWLRDIVRENGGVTDSQIRMFITKAAASECAAWQNDLSREHFSAERSAKAIKSYLLRDISYEMPEARYEKMEQYIAQVWEKMSNIELELAVTSLGAVTPKPPQKTELTQLEKASGATSVGMSR